MLEHNLANKINDIASFLKQHLTETPKNGLILGSGLGTIIDDFETKIVTVYIQKIRYSWLGKVGFCEFMYNTDTRQYYPVNYVKQEELIESPF